MDGMEPPSIPATSAPPRSRLRFRLSVRCLMVIVLAVALVLGWFAEVMREAREQREAVEAIKGVGGLVYYSHELVDRQYVWGRSPGAPAWLRRLTGDDPFQTVDTIVLNRLSELEGKSQDEADAALEVILSRVEHLRGVKLLTLPGSYVTDSSLEHVGRMTTLEGFDAPRAERVTDAGVKHLAGLRSLQYIDLGYSGLSDSGLEVLAGLPALETLRVHETRVSDRGVGAVSRIPNLKEFMIGDCKGRITDQGLVQLVRARRLKSLCIPGTALTDDGLMKLAALPDLKELWVGATRVTNEGKQAFRRLRPGVAVYP